MPPEQRRAVLVQATLPLLLAHGTAITTRQIAEAAGIAEGTIFRVFPDKESLIEAVVEAAFDPTPFEADLARIPMELPLPARLERAVDLLQRRIASIGRLMAAAGMTRPPGGAAAAVQHRPPTSVEALARLFEPEQDRLRRSPVDAAVLLRAMTFAGTHPMMVEEPMRPAEIVDLVLHGIDGTEVPPC
jgi:AcrR family transcriptional regulator